MADRLSAQMRGWLGSSELRANRMVAQTLRDYKPKTEPRLNRTATVSSLLIEAVNRLLRSREKLPPALS